MRRDWGGVGRSGARSLGKGGGGWELGDGSYGKNGNYERIKKR